MDGETFPSHLGTGSEDYYGYAWGRRERITDHPFIAQPEGAGADSAGFVQNTRLPGAGRDSVPYFAAVRYGALASPAGRRRLRSDDLLVPASGRAQLGRPNEKEAARKVSLHREDLVSQKMEINGRGRTYGRREQKSGMIC